jgi:hypothetical protein
MTCRPRDDTVMSPIGPDGHESFTVSDRFAGTSETHDAAHDTNVPPGAAIPVDDYHRLGRSTGRPPQPAPPR